MNKIVLFKVLILFFLNSYAQKTLRHHDSHLRSSSGVKFPWGVYFGVGSNSYYGDLSGFRHSFKAINYQFTAGLTYRWSKKFTAGLSYRILRITASDAESSSESIGRKKRNLSFSNMVQEFSLTSTFDLFGFNWKHTPDYSHATGFFPYIIGSAGFVLHNPTAELDGTKYELRNLKTSKEKMDGSVNYSLIAPFISYGIGGKIKFSQFACVGIEVTYTNTFTDYLDDIGSGTYYPINNNDPDFANSIEGRLADRSLETSLNTSRIANGGITKRSFDEKGARNDGYFTTTIKIDYAFQSFRNFRNDKSSHFKQKFTPFHKH